MKFGMLTRTMSSDPPRHALQAGHPDSIAEGTFPRIARATRLTSTGFGPNREAGSDGRTISTRKTPRPRALSADAAIWPPQESQPLRKPLGSGRALRTHT